MDATKKSQPSTITQMYCASINKCIYFCNQLNHSSNVQFCFLTEVLIFKTYLQYIKHTIAQLQNKKMYPYYVSGTVKCNCCTYFFPLGILKMLGKCPLLTSLKPTKPLPRNHSLCRNFISSSIIFYSLIWELRISGVLCSTLITDTLLYKVYHYYCTACVSSLQSSLVSFKKTISLYQNLTFFTTKVVVVLGVSFSIGLLLLRFP